MGIFMFLAHRRKNFSRLFHLFEKLNWAKGIDANGRPIRTGVIPTAKVRAFAQGFGGATNWFSPSYNPVTKLFYFLADEDCNIYYLKPEEFGRRKNLLFNRRAAQRWRPFAKISAGLRLESDKATWRYEANRCRAFFRWSDEHCQWIGVFWR